MNIEESIKPLRILMSKYKQIDEVNNFDHELALIIDYTELSAIETLLTAYEKEKENNKELRKYYATRKEVEELREINECLHDSAENYIHKNKVIEKVKEIKDRPVKDEFITATQGKLDTIIDIESLLNEEE